MLRELRAGMLAILRLPDQPQCDAEADLCKEPPILGICDSPDLCQLVLWEWARAAGRVARLPAVYSTHLSEDPRVEPRLFKKLDS